MAFPMQGTPQRPLPGAFMQTPAAARSQSVSQFGGSGRPPPFRLPSSSALPRPQAGPPSTTQTASSETPIEKAAKALNTKQEIDRRFPPLDAYVPQGVSSEYDVPTTAPWSPFQKTKVYEIPDKIFEQYNLAQMSTMMGLFAELQHAWVAIDNALYIWDYTHPNPQLLGFEEQPHTITAVKLTKPRAGVFLPAITHALVVATLFDICIIGLASEKSPAGVITVSLFRTGMKTSVKGLNISAIAGSEKTGRIFFAGRNGDDIYELTYQQEERWFQSKCGKICHTSHGLGDVVSLKNIQSMVYRQHQDPEHVEQMVVDDTRELLYVLSSKSTIRVFYIKPGNGLALLITRNLQSIMSNISHIITRMDLFPKEQTIVSIDPISATESSRLNLVATASNGMRLYFSATSGSYSYYSSSSAGNISSMQVHHVRFPPPMPGTATQQAPPQSAGLAGYQLTQAIDSPSNSLKSTRMASRFPPGYFFCFTGSQGGIDTLFMSAPDSGRISRSRTSQLSLFAETGQWLPLNCHAEDVGSITPPFAAATSSTTGFGNELAVQFDVPPTEIAVLTNTGVHTFRRRRMVDILASTLKVNNTEEAFEDLIKKFISLYGRDETCATALAVACGQGSDTSSDGRPTAITDPEVVEQARRAYIEHGGKASLEDNVDASMENVRLSSRAQGLATYISRLVRSVWTANVIKESTTPTGALSVSSTVALNKLRDLQKDLTRLKEFLDANKSYIEGLTGPEALATVKNQQEEFALKGEHQALNAQVRLIANVIEGIAFVVVLFDEPVDEIILSLGDATRQRVRQLTYEALFSTTDGRELAKELVKAIVNRSISRGSNVDTVAEALRRRCGSFCSAEDVVIFKAQEQLKKASEAGADSSSGRSLLNEGLKLFEKVAGSLTMEHLQMATEQYIAMSFYAGAIRLALTVAQELDRANRALSWIRDGSPEPDPRKAAYESRMRCYRLITEVIGAVDRVKALPGDDITASNIARRKAEAYQEINQSDDEVFQTYLYDWYLSQGWSNRLLDISSPYVVSYLRRKAKDDIAHSDLLWQYYAHYNAFFEAAQVQLELARSGFDLNLSRRMEYLSRAKANAASRIRSNGLRDIGRSTQSRQEVLREISDLLDLATVQAEILSLLEKDPRVPADRRPTIIKELNGSILPLEDVRYFLSISARKCFTNSLSQLFQNYADQAAYYDICLVIYQLADYRNSSDIAGAWQNLVQAEHDAAEARADVVPWEVVSEKVRSLGRRLELSETTFPIPIVLPILLQYMFAHPAPGRNETWAIDLLSDLGVSYETILGVLESLFYRKTETAWAGTRHEAVARLMVYVSRKWLEQSGRGGGILFGSDENAVAVADVLGAVLDDKPSCLGAEERERAALVKEQIARVLR